jgi:hypothetical protein
LWINLILVHTNPINTGIPCRTPPPQSIIFPVACLLEENRIPKRVLSMKLEATRPRGIPRNRWQDEMSEDGRIVGGEEWQGKVYNREE